MAKVEWYVRARHVELGASEGQKYRGAEVLADFVQDMVDEAMKGGWVKGDKREGGMITANHACAAVALAAVFAFVNETRCRDAGGSGAVSLFDADIVFEFAKEWLGLAADEPLQLISYNNPDEPCSWSTFGDLTPSVWRRLKERKEENSARTNG